MELVVVWMVRGVRASTMIREETIETNMNFGFRCVIAD